MKTFQKIFALKIIIAVCLLILQATLFCFASQEAGQNECLNWNDPTETVCPDDYQSTDTVGEYILLIGDAIKMNGVQRQGSCWNFVKAVYDCAGYDAEQVFPLHAKCEKAGPYLKDKSFLQPGDWVMHINHEYRQKERIEHSAIFVRWIDKQKKKALMLDYVGNNQCVEPSYKEHVLSEVYCVMRAVGTEPN